MEGDIPLFSIDLQEIRPAGQIAGIELPQAALVCRPVSQLPSPAYRRAGSAVPPQSHLRSGVNMPLEGWGTPGTDHRNLYL